MSLNCREAVYRHVEYADAVFFFGFANGLFNFFKEVRKSTLVNKIEWQLRKQGQVKQLTAIALRRGSCTVRALSNDDHCGDFSCHAKRPHH